MAIHSACHGPVERSKSWIMASSIKPACWRTPLAAAYINSQEIGLRFCGMVLLAPRPLTKGSYTSPNSLVIIIITSNAILPREPVTSPRKFRVSARPSRATCQVACGMPSPSSAIKASWTSRPLSPNEASVPAAPANWPTSTRGRNSTRRSA
ncbi:hypothetical protein D3C87_1667150 [compost metagenome]